MVYDDRHDGKVDDRTVAQLVNDLSEQTSRLVRNEAKVAISEMKTKGKRFGIGAGLAAGAGVIALYALGVLIAAAVLALAIVLPAWASALIIGGGMLLFAGVLGLVGKQQVQRATPPIPRETVLSVRKDIDTVRERMRR